MAGHIHVVAIKHEKNDKVVIHYCDCYYRRNSRGNLVLSYNRDSTNFLCIEEVEYALVRKILRVRSLFGKNAHLDGGFACSKRVCPGWIIMDGGRQAPIKPHFLCPYGREKCFPFTLCVGR